jgi:hypothetical protein
LEVALTADSRNAIFLRIDAKIVLSFTALKIGKLVWEKKI